MCGCEFSVDEMSEELAAFGVHIKLKGDVLVPLCPDCLAVLEKHPQFYAPIVSLLKHLKLGETLNELLDMPR